MEAAIMVLVFVAIAIVADRFGDHRRPVHQSTAYHQALTGMIHEPMGRTHVVAPRPRSLDRATEDTAREPDTAPPDLAVQPM